MQEVTPVRLDQSVTSTNTLNQAKSILSSVLNNIPANRGAEMRDMPLKPAMQYSHLPDKASYTPIQYQQNGVNDSMSVSGINDSMSGITMSQPTRSGARDRQPAWDMPL